jgi:hypothetical protein
MAKPIIRIDKMREDDFENLAMRIIDSTDGNEHYPDPIPPLTLLKKQLATYRSARVAAANRDTYLIEVRKQARKALEESLRQLVIYVQKKTGTNRAILLTSGFNLTKEKEPAGILPKPEHFRIEHPGPGRVILRVKSIKHARSYLFEYREKGTEQWTQVFSYKSSVMIDGLTSGREYEFRVSYRGTHPAVTYSDVITSYIL